MLSYQTCVRLVICAYYTLFVVLVLVNTPTFKVAFLALVNSAGGFLIVHLYVTKQSMISSGYSMEHGKDRIGRVILFSMGIACIVVVPFTLV